MGDFFELFGLKRVVSIFSKLLPVNITTEVWLPPPQVMSGPMGELQQAVAHLFINGF
jgi:hypothetical protein